MDSLVLPISCSIKHRVPISPVVRRGPVSRSVDLPRVSVVLLRGTVEVVTIRVGAVGNWASVETDGSLQQEQENSTDQHRKLCPGLTESAMIQSSGSH